eukprot:6639968-Prymnesium_polylepis.1
MLATDCLDAWPTLPAAARETCRSTLLDAASTAGIQDVAWLNDSLQALAAPVSKKLCLPFLGSASFNGNDVTPSSLLSSAVDGGAPDLKRVAAITTALSATLGFTRATCTAGEQCIGLPLSGFLLGSCSTCLRGQHCPNATTNPLGSSVLNHCPEGFRCPGPDRTLPCEAGRFCFPGTFDRGLPCPTRTRMWIKARVGWSLAIHCPQGTSEYYSSVCPAGKSCPSPAIAQPCAAGSYC